MKTYTNLERAKAEELLRKCYNIEVEEIGSANRCVPIKLIGPKTCATKISAEMMLEYNYGQVPKESYEYERFIFWKNVHEILESIRF